MHLRDIPVSRLPDELAARGFDVSLQAYATGQNVVASLPPTSGAAAALRIVVDAAPRLKELGIPRTSLPGTWSKRGRTVL